MILEHILDCSSCHHRANVLCLFGVQVRLSRNLNQVGVSSCERRLPREGREEGGGRREGGGSGGGKEGGEGGKEVEEAVHPHVV